MAEELASQLLKGRDLVDKSDVRYRKELETFEGDNEDDKIEDAAPNLEGHCANQLNNAFEHQCFDEAVKYLGAKPLAVTPQDIGDPVLSIPGIPNGRFLAHQVWGAWYCVRSIINNNGLKGVMVADDMGMGKTFTALATALHLKWLADEAEKGVKLPCYAGETVEEQKEKPQFFGDNIGWIKRPILIVVPPMMIRTWHQTIKSLTEGTDFSLHVVTGPNHYPPSKVNIQLARTETGRRERGRRVYLTTYPTLRSRILNSKELEGAEFGIAIFDEFHSVKKVNTMTYKAIT